MASLEDSRSSAEAVSRARAPSTSRRTRPQRSSSQLASSGTLKVLNVELPLEVLPLKLPERWNWLALVRWRVALGSAEIWGKKSARATLTRLNSSHLGISY